MEDLAHIVIHTWQLLMRPPLTTALPGLGVELAGHPQAAAAYRERVIAPLRNGAIDAIARAVAAGQWDGPDPDTAVDMLVGTFVYRLAYLGQAPELDEVFRVAELVAGRALPRGTLAP
ncbi:TetR-like C-terminal domain-containing protein [Actinomyces ruminis]|uniref:TetR-like C-terminal domain-containing protein n=1 Tax=Actinomyces ruminis TaxID=1937003 RepID=UPI0030B83D26